MDLIKYFLKPNIKYKVYGVKDTSGVIRYIGCTYRTLDVRLINHRSDAKLNKSKSTSARIKYFQKVNAGIEEANIFLIQEFDNPFEASFLESELIRTMDGLVNSSLYSQYKDQYSVEWFLWMKKRGGMDLINKMREKYLIRYNLKPL
jgi:hypothetical protein